MAICVPVRDMKDTAAFASLVARENDVTVTRNGYEAMHCLSDERYRFMQEEAAKVKLLSRMLVAERERTAGKASDYISFASSLRNEYGL